MKIAESGPLVVQMDYDTGENYSLSSTIFAMFVRRFWCSQGPHKDARSSPGVRAEMDARSLA